MLKALSVWMVVFGALAICGAPSSPALEELILPQDDHRLEMHSHIHEPSTLILDMYSDEDLKYNYEYSSIDDDTAERMHVMPRITRSLPIISGVLKTPKGLISKTNGNGGAGSASGQVVGTANQQLDNVKTEVGQTGGLLIRGKANIAGSIKSEANRQFNTFGQQIGQAGGSLLQTKTDAASSIGGVIGIVDKEVDNIKTQAGQTGGVLIKGKATVTGALGDLLPFGK